jgi:hypothetical protein
MLALMLLLAARPGVEFKIFQFPANQIPRIDGQAEDWSMVPASYAIGSDQLKDTVNSKGTRSEGSRCLVKWDGSRGSTGCTSSMRLRITTWDFKAKDLHNDIFELVVDGDRSGGPFIRQMHPDESLRENLATHRKFHGVHAQNYHIFTPSGGQGLDDGVGFAALDQGAALGQRGVLV